MSKKTETKSTTNFDPQSMNRYQGWQNALLPGLESLWQNPLSSPFFNLNLQQQGRTESALAGRGMQNVLQQFGRAGFGASGSSPLRAALLNSLGRFGSGLQFQGFMNAVNQAQADRWNAANLGSQLFQPLTTGQTQIQKTSGLGTWLPQVIGGGLSLATGFMGGGGMFGGGGGGLTQLPTGLNSSQLGNLGFGGGGSGYFTPGPLGGGGFANFPSYGGSYNPFGFNP